MTGETTDAGVGEPTYADGIEAAAGLAALYDTGEAAARALVVAANMARRVAADIPATPDADNTSTRATEGLCPDCTPASKCDAHWCCAACDRATPDWLRARVSAAATRAADDRRERIAQAIEALKFGERGTHQRALRLARETP